MHERHTCMQHEREMQRMTMQDREGLQQIAMHPLRQVSCCIACALHPAAFVHLDVVPTPSPHNNGLRIPGAREGRGK